MPEASQNIAVPFLEGIDTKTDGKLLPVGKLRNLENGIFVEGGSIKKRAGYTSIRPLDSDGLDLSSPSRLVERQGETLMLSDGAISALNRSSRWENQDYYVPLSVDREELPSVVGEQTYADSISNGVITVYAWQDSRGGVRATAIDSSNGTEYAYDIEVDSGGTQPRLTLVDGEIMLLYIDEAADSLYCKEINDLDPGASFVAGAATIYDDVNDAFYSYDVWYDRETGRSVAACYSNDNTEHLIVTEIAAGGVAGTQTPVDLFDSMGLTESGGPDLISITRTPNNSWVVIGCSDGGQLVYRQDFTSDLTESTFTSGTDLAQRSGSNDVTGITAVFRDTAAANEIWGVYSFTGVLAEPAYRTTGWGDWTSGTDDYAVQGIYVRSRAIRNSQGAFMVFGSDSQNNLQNSELVYNLDNKECISRLNYGESMVARGAASDQQFPTLWTLDDGVTVQYATSRRRRISSLGQALDAGQAAYSTFQNLEVAHYSMTFGQTALVNDVEIGESLYLSTGNLMSYDGFRLEEAAPLFFPELTGAGISSDSAGSNLQENATYLYRIYYAKEKSNGETVRSLALTYIITLPAGDNQVSMNIGTLTSGSDLDRYRIEVYRSQANQIQQLNLVSSPDLTVTTGDNRYLVNDPTAESVAFVDDLADTAAIQRATDPQSSGVLPLVAPAPASVMGQAGGRVFLAGGDRPPGLISTSLPYFPGEALQFADENQFSVEGEGGDVVAMGAIDNILIIFKERRIYAVGGDGFSDVGTGNGFFPERITTDVGCSDPGSVVEMPDGLMFKSAKGIYIVNRSLETEYIGWPVEELNTSTMSSACVIPDTNLVVFLASDGTTVAYDYFFKRWTKFTNHRGLSSTAKNSVYRYLRSDGEMFTRDENTYLDDGAWYALKLRTAPIRFTSIQDYMQVRRVNILGEYLSAHRLQMSVYCDRDLMPFEQKVFEVMDVVDTTLWGDTDADLWGDDDSTPWGGQSGSSQYRFQHKFKRQKVQALALEFTDLQTDGAPGQSYELAEMNFEVDLFSGNARVPARSKI
jgi:hypothetical protein